MTELRVDVYTWLALLMLLAVTCGSSYIPLGPFNIAVNLAVAVVKVLLVALVFMKLRKEHPLIRLVAVVGVIWLGILAGLSATDFIARGW